MSNSNSSSSSEQLLTLTHKLNDEHQQHFSRALCTGNYTPIEGGQPLVDYLNGDSDLWQHVMSQPLDDIPESFKVVPGQRETIEPVWSGKWVNRYTMERFAENPRINKHTGKLEARIRLSGVPALVDATIKKTEIIPQDMWRQQSQPLQSKALRRQLQNLCSSVERGAKLSSSTAVAITVREPHGQSRVEEQQLSEEADVPAEQEAKYNDDNDDTLSQTSSRAESISTAGESISGAGDETESEITQVFTSPHNGAYLEVLAHYALDYLRENRHTPFAPIYYYSARLTDANFFKGREKHYNPMPIVLLGLEHLHHTLKTSWTEDPYLDGRRVMADLFQIVHGLATLQAHLGLVHGAFDLTTVRCRFEKPTPQQMDPKHPEFGGPFIYYQWGGKYYRVPTFGSVWKPVDLDYVSLVFRGQRLVSLDVQEEIRTKPIPYQQDLVTFARHAIPVLQKELIEEDPLKVPVLELLHRWTTCWSATQLEAETIDPVETRTGDNAEDLTQLEVEVCRNHTSPECKNQFFERLGRNTVCSNAIPYMQQNEFALFEIPRTSVPTTVTVYRLMIPLAAPASPSLGSTDTSVVAAPVVATPVAPAPAVSELGTGTLLIAASRTRHTTIFTGGDKDGHSKSTASRRARKLTAVDDVEQAKQMLRSQPATMVVICPKVSERTRDYTVLYRKKPGSQALRRGQVRNLGNPHTPAYQMIRNCNDPRTIGPVRSTLDEAVSCALDDADK